MFRWAPQPDVVRCVQKDEYYASVFSEECKELGALLLGRRGVRLRDELDLAGRALFFGCTSLAGRPTIGEEYCDLRQVCAATGAPPGAGRRAALLVARVLAPYVAGKVRRHGRRAAVRPSASRAAAFARRCWNRIVDAAGASEAPEARARQLHLAVFYLTGAYLEVSKRLAGVRFVLVRKPAFERASYQLLGVLLLAQLCGAAAVGLRERVEEARKRREEAEEGEAAAAADAWNLVAPAVAGGDGAEALGDGAPDCMLCLSRRRHTTATECGHLFCWACICECLTNKPECPLCRQAASLQGLVRLASYA